MKKIDKPTIPSEYFISKHQIGIYNGKTLKEVISELPDDIDFSKVEFYEHITYYDDVGCVFKYELKEKYKPGIYAAMMKKYEKQLEKYNKQEEKEK